MSPCVTRHGAHGRVRRAVRASYGSITLFEQSHVPALENEASKMKAPGLMDQSRDKMLGAVRRRSHANACPGASAC